MITPETIQAEILKLTAEETALRASHEKLVREHQQRVARVQEIATANASRMQQITGALASLKQLLNGQEEKPNQESTPPT